MSPVDAAPAAAGLVLSAEIDQVQPDLTGDEVPNVDQYVLLLFYYIWGFKTLGLLLGFFPKLCR
jgi:hypothetical protein